MIGHPSFAVGRAVHGGGDECPRRRGLQGTVPEDLIPEGLRRGQKA